MYGPQTIISRKPVKCPFVFKTLGLKLLTVLCDDHVTGVLAQMTCPTVHIQQGEESSKPCRMWLNVATGVINTVLFKCFQAKKQLDYIKL